MRSVMADIRLAAVLKVIVDYLSVAMSANSLSYLFTSAAKAT